MNSSKRVTSHSSPSTRVSATRLLRELPASRDAEKDFRRWQDDRLMVHYRPVKPWCELVLRRHLPHAVHGDWRGISFRFPMERLFEDYVGSVHHMPAFDSVVATASPSPLMTV
ncbi:5-methylcytosine restriction system specificity protein McrC [Caballeronia sp. LZ032]|uniref:5-methylcytosine restriction system specificity protein McrC n=1 Tax=Caballeronia sp. LZ032 TaxID=3038565 RepID=UPI0038D4A3AF